jgi:CheY-like chemotaxis protein
VKEETMNRVLLVEPDPMARRTYGAWLEEAGYEVTACPGPTAPDYTCVGGREDECPLIEPADVVLLNLDLDSDVHAVGTSSFELLTLYSDAGKPVVALGKNLELVRMFSRRRISELHAPPSRERLLRSVKAALAIDVA